MWHCAGNAGAFVDRKKMDPTKYVLDAQCQFWKTNFSPKPEMFGDASSDPAQKALELLKLEGRASLLKLGGGQGWDTFLFARMTFTPRLQTGTEIGLPGVGVHGTASNPGSNPALCSRQKRHDQDRSDESSGVH